MQRAIITGLTGFVGPYLAMELRAHGIDAVGLSVGKLPFPHPISIDDLRSYDLDIRDRSAVRDVIRREKPDFIIHMAAISHVPTSVANPELTFDINVGGTFNLLEAVRQLAHRPRVLYVSTGNVYGNVESGTEGFSENSTVQATSPYATSKLIGEQLVRSYVEDFGIAIVTARPFNHTGPGQPPSFVCSEWARAVAAGAKSGNPVHMRTGLLDPARDITDVRDVVRAYVALVQRGNPGDIYNVCSSTMIRIGDIIPVLAEIGKIKVTTEIDPAKVRSREIMQLGGNSSKLRRELAWHPEIELGDTLRDLVNYWMLQI